MANVHSAIKQIRKDVKRRERNQAVLSELQTLWKKLLHLPASEKRQAEALAQILASKWDRAASGKIVPKGRADRKKARVARLLARLTPSP